MKNLFLSFLLMGLGSLTYAQQYYPTGIQSRETVSIYGGFTGFFGDIEGSNSFIDTNPHLGIAYEYALSQRFAARAYGLYYKIEAQDSKAIKEDLKNRNLSFFSNNFEAGLMLTGYFLKQPIKNFTNRRRVNLYGLVGLGFTYYNPKTTLDGKVYALRKYKTEGKAYSKIAPVIPFGGGLVVKLNDRVDIAGEAKFHYALTDFLDDCSSRYLTEYSSELQESLADRRLEGEGGGQRGNPTISDGYGTYSIRVGYKLLQYKYRAKDLKKKLRKRYKS